MLKHVKVCQNRLKLDKIYQHLSDALKLVKPRWTCEHMVAKW